MKTWLRSPKLLAGLISMVAVMAAAPVVHGGLLWTGIDPIFDADGKTINVWVEWPSGRECSITGPISVDVHTSAKLVAESIETFACPSGDHSVETRTTVKNVGLPFHFNVKRVYVPASSTFPVQVKIYKEGELATTCLGLSNTDISCSIVSLN